MKKQTKEDLRWFMTFIIKGAMIALALTAALIGISVLVEYVIGPVLDTALWGVWEFIMKL